MLEVWAPIAACAGSPGRPVAAGVPARLRSATRRAAALVRGFLVPALALLVASRSVGPIPAGAVTTGAMAAALAETPAAEPATPRGGAEPRSGAEPEKPGADRGRPAEEATGAGGAAEVETETGTILVEADALSKVTWTAPTDDSSPPRAPVPPISLPAKGGLRSVPLEDILSIRLPVASAPPSGAVLYLRTGGRLAGSVVAGDGDSLQWKSPSLGDDPLRVELEQVRGIRYLPPPTVGGPTPTREERTREEALQRSIESEILSARPKSDVIVLLEGGRAQGVVESIDAEGVRVSSDSLGKVPIPRSKLRAVILAPLDSKDAPAITPGARADPLAVRVTLRDGSELPGRISGLADGALRVRAPPLGDLAISLSQVLDVAFLGGRTRYLSDLDPESALEDPGPLLRLKRPFRRDSSVVGTPLRMGGRTYRKGLGVQARTRLVYPLDPDTAAFRATVGLDETATPPADAVGRESMGSVVFRVKLDGKVVLEKPMTWRDAPVPIDVPVAGEKRLELEVDFGGPPGGYSAALGRADWAEARLVRKRTSTS